MKCVPYMYGLNDLNADTTERNSIFRRGIIYFTLRSGSRQKNIVAHALGLSSYCWRKSVAATAYVYESLSTIYGWYLISRARTGSDYTFLNAYNYSRSLSAGKLQHMCT